MATASSNPLVPPEFLSAVRRALATPPAGVDPWFLRYCGDLADDRGALTYARAKWQLVSLAGGVRGKVVVDARSATAPRTSCSQSTRSPTTSTYAHSSTSAHAC